MPTPTAPPSPAARPRESLVRVIGTLGLAAAIVNITIGGGIFRLPANVAGSLGAAAPLAYLVCAVAMGLIVLCIADAGSRVSLTGGPYAYVGTAFGPYAGFLSGVLLWMLGTFATAAVATVFASSVGLLVPALAGRGMEIALLVAAFAFWSLVNLRGVTLGVRLNSIATVAKLLPLLLIAIGGAFFVDADNLQMADDAAGSRRRAHVAAADFRVRRHRVALVPSGEVRDTARTVPRAIALAMVGITALYIALQMVAQGILGSGLAQATVSPLADAAGASLGGWARSLLLVGRRDVDVRLSRRHDAVDAAHAVRARTRRLPAARARGGASAPRAPQAAIVVQSLIALALAISGTFERLAILANVSALALYLGCALAAWRLRRLGIDGDGASFRVPLGGVVPWLAWASSSGCSPG